MSRIVLIIIHCAWTIGALQAVPMDQELATAGQLLRQAKQDNHELLENMSVRRQQLEGHRQTLLQELETLQTRIAEDEEQWRQMVATRKLMSKSATQRLEDERNINKVVHDSGLVLLNHITALPSFNRDMQRYVQLEREFSSASDDTQARMRLIFAEAMEELLQSRRVFRYKADISSLDGETRRAEVLLFGQMQAFYSAGADFGRLQAVTGGHHLHASPVPLGEGEKNDLIQAYAGLTIENMHFDVTGNAVKYTKQVRQNFREWFASAGIVGWPIAFLGILGLLMILERFWTLNRVHARTDQFMMEISNFMDEGLYDKALDLCQSRPWAVARVMLAGLKSRGQPRETVVNAMEEAILHELPCLEKNLSYINVIAAVAPLLGLLGTVTGMVTTFDVISFFGNADAQLMAGGISEALVTTEMGLIVAVPVLLFNNYLSGRVDHVMSDMEKYAATLANTLARGDHKAEPRSMEAVHG